MRTLPLLLLGVLWVAGGCTPVNAGYYRLGDSPEKSVHVLETTHWFGVKKEDRRWDWADTTEPGFVGYVPAADFKQFMSLNGLRWGGGYLAQKHMRLGEFQKLATPITKQEFESSVGKLWEADWEAYSKKAANAPTPVDSHYKKWKRYEEDAAGNPLPVEEQVRRRRWDAHYNMLRDMGYTEAQAQHATSKVYGERGW